MIVGKHHKLLAVIFCLSFAADAFSHDGPHDDFPVPKYAKHQQDGQAKLTVNRSKNSFVVSLQAPLQIFTGSPLVDKKAFKAAQTNAKQTLDSYEKIISLVSSKPCKPGFKSVDLQHKHRLIQDLPQKKVTGKMKDKLIKPFTDLLASFKVVCDKTATFEEITINIFDIAPHLAELSLTYSGNGKEINRSFFPNKVKLPK